MQTKNKNNRLNNYAIKLFIAFLLVGIFSGIGVAVYIEKANADQLGGVSMSAMVPPNFNITFKDSMVVIETNMKVVVNGKEVK